jgi:leucine dehydrogenase
MNIQEIKVPEYEKVVKCELLPGITSIIAVHNTALGPGLGGVRMHDYHSEQEALTDVLRLAEGMSYKAAMAELKLGGGKSVIIGKQSDKSPELFEAYGEFVNSLKGLYVSAKDVGVDLNDLASVEKKTKFIGGTAKEGSSGDPSFMTAYGVYQGLRAVSDVKWGEDSLKDKTILVQGLGHVGFDVIQYLQKAGANVIGCDLNEERMMAAKEKYGIDIQSANDWLDIQADILCPCALGGILNQDTIPKLLSNGIQVIAGGANNQLLDMSDDGWRLHQKGIIFAPDYVINAGGIINIFCEFDGYDEKRARKITENIYSTTKKICDRAAQTDRPTALVSLDMARERIGLV